MQKAKNGLVAPTVFADLTLQPARRHVAIKNTA
jgi:hypothetical protein